MNVIKLSSQRMASNVKPPTGLRFTLKLAFTGSDEQPAPLVTVSVTVLGSEPV